MAELALAALFLPVSHFGISSTALRAWLVGRVGERAYLGLYSVVTIGAFFWLVRSYRLAETELLWIAPPSIRWLAIVMAFVGVVLAAVGLTTPNPMVVGADALFDQPGVVHGVDKKAKQHPERWRSFSAATSSVPFLAIAQGRQRFALNELGLWRLAAGVAVFALLLFSHPWLFGVSPVVW